MPALRRGGLQAAGGWGLRSLPPRGPQLRERQGRGGRSPEGQPLEVPFCLRPYTEPGFEDLDTGLPETCECVHACHPKE